MSALYRMCAVVVATLLLCLPAVEVPAQASFFIQNSPSALCTALSKRVYSEFKRGGTETDWDFAESSRFLRNLLGSNNPHVSALAPVVMLRARKMREGLRESKTKGLLSISITENFDACVSSMQKALFAQRPPMDV